jgi:hypothetical protein
MIVIELIIVITILGDSYQVSDAIHTNGPHEGSEICSCYYVFAILVF